MKSLIELIKECPRSGQENHTGFISAISDALRPFNDTNLQLPGFSIMDEVELHSHHDEGILVSYQEALEALKVWQEDWDATLECYIEDLHADKEAQRFDKEKTSREYVIRTLIPVYDALQSYGLVDVVDSALHHNKEL